MKWDQLREIAQAVGSFVALALAGFLGWWGKNRHAQTQNGVSISPPIPASGDFGAQLADVQRMVAVLYRAGIREDNSGARKIAADENTDRILTALSEAARSIAEFGQILSADSQRRTGMVEKLSELHEQIDRRIAAVEASNRDLKDDTAEILLHLRKGFANG
jgi:hypothetical protein